MSLRYLHHDSKFGYLPQRRLIQNREVLEAMGKATIISKRQTKTEILSEIAENTQLSKKQVEGVLDELTSLIERHIKKRAVGEFVMPGLFKISTVNKQATKARKGINPFTGEETVFKAKPATTVVKIRPLAKLKEMVG